VVMYLKARCLSDGETGLRYSADIDPCQEANGTITRTKSFGFLERSSFNTRRGDTRANSFDVHRRSALSQLTMVWEFLAGWPMRMWRISYLIILEPCTTYLRESRKQNPEWLHDSLHVRTKSGCTILLNRLHVVSPRQ
jgi:hypothetical protein